MIYMHALEDVYGILQSIALMSWADHYDDFTHHSRWYDLIFPGTPPGVGMARKPPVDLKASAA